jgi:hypothetical protein
MPRRLVAFLLLAGVFAAPAHGATKLALVPGVTYEQGIQFTTHGAVAFHVITAPRPGSAGGLYGFGPVLGRGTMTGGRERVTQIEKDVTLNATVAGINGDLFNWGDSHPSGIYLEGGVLKHPPFDGRSSIGIDSTGGLHVDRVKFFGTWRGTGQRRPLTGLNQTPSNGQVMLFTPAWGPATPRIGGAAEVVLQPFPAAVPNVDLAATVTATAVGGGTPIPPDGAVLMAVGAAIAPKLQAEAPVATTLTTRLILQPDWTGVVDALGGGPVLVRNGAPVFRSLEDFDPDQITSRNPRAGVGQTADGRILLVAVDGRQPGYSVGMTSFELAQTLARLGAVTASAVDSGGSVTVAFDGELLNRPSDPGGERAVKEALLVKYYGVYAPPLDDVDKDDVAKGELLVYKLVRPSTVTAELLPPDQVPRPVDAGAGKQPGFYRYPYTELDQEGTWHWIVQATDDLNRTSTIDRTFQVDFTLSALRVPRSVPRSAGVTVRFTLSRPARVALRIETRLGTIVKTFPARALSDGEQSLQWDAHLSKKTKAFPGSYVARVIATSEIGTMDLAAPFTLRK